MMSFYRNIESLLKPYKEGSTESRALKTYRIYCLLGVVITLIITIGLGQDQSTYNALAQAIIASGFIIVLTLTYFNNWAKKNVGHILFVFFIVITLYVMREAHKHDFAVNDTFALIILLFVFSIILRNPKEVLIYFGITAAAGTIALLTVDQPMVSRSYLVTFFVVFFWIGFLVIRNRTRVLDRLRERENFHKTLFNEAFDAILLVDYYSRIVVDCNDMAVRMFQVEDKNEIIGFERDKFQKVKPTKQELLECRKEFMQKGIWRTEAQYVSEKGREFWVELVMTPLHVKEANYYVTRLVDITIKKEAQKAFFESDQKFRTLVENMNEGILRTDTNEVTQYVNDRYCEIVGYDKRELIGKVPYEIVEHDKESERRVKETVKLRAEGDSSKYEIRLHTKSGKWIWVAVSGTPVFDNDGNVVGSMGIMTDVTEKKEAEEVIRVSEERYRQLFERNLAGVFRTELGGRVLECNEAYASILGYTTRGEMIGRNSKEFYFNQSERKSYIDELRKKGTLTNYELKHKHRDGSEIWVLENVSLVQSQDGKTDLIEGTAIEITDLKQATEALRESQENMSMVLKSIDSMVYSVRIDKKGRRKLEYMSPLVEKIFGYTQEDFDKGQINLRDYYHPEDLPTLVKDVQAIKEEQRPVNLIYRFKHIKTKEYRWIEESIFPQFNEQGDHVANFGITRDISDKILAEQALRESEERHRLMFEQNPLPMVMYDRKSLQFIDVNQEAIRHYGYSRKEFLEMTIKDIRPKEELPQLEEHLESQETEKEEILRLPGDWKHVKKDGTVIDVEITRSRINLHGRNVNIALIKDVTSERLTQEQLKLSEQRFRILSEAAFEGILFSENGTIIDANDQFVKMHGYKDRNEIIGKKYDDFVVPEQIDEVYQYIKKKKPTKPMELRSRKKDGEIITVESRGRNFTYQGKTVRVSAINNITERKKYEQELEESRENFQNLVEYSPDGIIIQLDGKVQYANSKALELIGFKNKEEIKNININDTLLPEYRDKALKRVNDLKAGVDVPFTEVKIKRPDGSIIELETKPIAFKFKGQDTIQIVLHDIAERKLLESEKLRAEIAEETNIKLQKEIEERTKIEKQLKENEQYTRRIIDSSLDMICAADKNGKITEFNKAAQKTFGYSLKEITGKDVAILYAHAKDRKEVTNHVLKGAKTFSGEIINKRKNGEEFTAYLSAAVLRNDDGDIEGMVGVSRDITQIKKAEEELIKSEERYRDLFENATDLIQSVDQQGNIVYVNNAWKKTLGYSSKDINGKSIFDVIHPECLHHCKKTFKKLYKGENLNNVEVSFLTKNNTRIDTLGDITVKQDNGKVVSTRGIFKDITEKKRNDEIQIVYNNIADLVSRSADLKEMCKEIHKELSAIMDVRNFTISLYNLNTKELSFPYHRTTRNTKLRTLPSRTGVNGFTEYLILKNKPLVLYEKDIKRIAKEENIEIIGPMCKTWLGIPLKVKNKAIGAIVVQNYESEKAYTKRDVSIIEFISGPVALAIQRRYDEQLISDQSARLRAIIESTSNIMIWTLDKEFKVTGYNKNFATTLSDRHGMKATTGLDFLKVIKPSVRDKYFKEMVKLYKKAFKGEPQQFEGKAKDMKGEVWIETFLNPIYQQQNRIEEISCLALDITEKKDAEKVLRKSLEEKEVLLKEVHHRVKNNLQVISSILNLQSSYVKDENTLEMLKESQNRIKSMSFIHENLYQTEDFSNINFFDYVLNLSNNLMQSYQIFGEQVNIKLDVDKVLLNLDQAIPCGLIINELVSNAFKYAFPNNRKGFVKVQVHEKGNTIQIVIADNGIGFPKDRSIENTDTLGLQLVTALVEQLSGKIDLDLTKGTKFIITFKRPKK